jgi:hypothetical protein
MMREPESGSSKRVADAYAHFLVMSGQAAKAVPILRRLAERAPLNFGPGRDLAHAMLTAFQYDECLALCDSLEVRFPGETSYMNYFRAYVYMLQGKIDKALEVGEISQVGRSFLIPIYWLDGQKEKAWAELESIKGSEMYSLHRMELLVLEEKYDQALDSLEAFATARPVLIKHFIHYPLFAPMEDNPRFRALMQGMNTPGY